MLGSTTHFSQPIQTSTSQEADIPEKSRQGILQPKEITSATEESECESIAEEPEQSEIEERMSKESQNH